MNLIQKTLVKDTKYLSISAGICTVLKNIMKINGQEL